MALKYSAIQLNETGHRHDSGSIIVTLSEAVISNLLAYAAVKKATQRIMESLSASLANKNVRVTGQTIALAGWFGLYPFTYFQDRE